MNIAGAVSSMMGNAMSAVNTIKTSFKKQQIEKAKAQAEEEKDIAKENITEYINKRFENRMTPGGFNGKS